MDQHHLSCEIVIHQAKNVEEFMALNKHYYKPNGKLFVRYYLSAGNNKKIQLNTKEIPTTTTSGHHHLSWDESTSLGCLGTQESIDSLRTSRVVFELRWRPSTSSTRSNMFSLGSGSKLVGRAELPLKSVMESSEMEIEQWMAMNPKNSNISCDGVKTPSVKVGMKVRVPSVMEMARKKTRCENNHECGCCRHSGCKDCDDYDVIALVAAFEGL